MKNYIVIFNLEEKTLIYKEKAESDLEAANKVLQKCFGYPPYSSLHKYRELLQYTIDKYIECLQVFSEEEYNAFI